MRKLATLLFSLGAMILFLSIGWGNVFAQDGQANFATADVFVSSSNSAFNGSNLRAAGSGSGSCAATVTTLVKFSVSEITDSNLIDSATIIFQVQNTGFSGTPITLSLSEATDGWSESDGTIDLGTVVGASLNSSLTFNSAPADGSDIVFPTSSQLVTYLRNQVNGDDVVSIAVTMTGCPTGSHIIRLEDREGGNSVAPTLDMRDPTAIQLESISVAGNNGNPLVWVAVALPLLVALGFLVLRRRGSNI